MASLSSEPTDRAIRYESLGNFYAADVRRRASRERDVGLWWRVGVDGPVYRAAWVQETGELYAIRLGPLRDGKGEVIVMGRTSGLSELEEVLQGWRDVCPQPDSLTWLRRRAAELAAPEKPARSFARAPASQLYGRAAGTFAHLRRQRRLSSADPAVSRGEGSRLASRSGG